MQVSAANSRLLYQTLKGCGIRVVSSVPESWLVPVIRMIGEDPEMKLVQVAKEEEGVGISAGAHLAGVKSAMIVPNHGFLAAVNPIVSLAHLYKIPLMMFRKSIIMCQEEQLCWSQSRMSFDRNSPMRVSLHLGRMWLSSRDRYFSRVGVASLTFRLST